MNIVCGTDLSVNSELGVRAAAALARRLKRPLKLAFALDPSAGGGLSMEARELMHAHMRMRLTELADDLRARNVEVDEEVLAGPADEALANYAEQVGAMMVVVSWMGHRNPNGFRLGGIADRLAQRSRVPVLVVRDAAPFEAWSEGQRGLEAMVGFDFTLASENAFRFVARLREAGAVHVTATHVYWPVGERVRLGIASATEIEATDPTIERVLLRDLEERVGVLPGTGELRLRVRMGYGPPALHLVHFAQQAGVDLVAVGAHQRGPLGRLWHGSVAHTVLRESNANVLIVPRATTVEEEHVGRTPCLNNVLAATDLKPGGNEAVRYAYGIACNGGTVHIAHVLEKGEPNPQEVLVRMRRLVAPRPEVITRLHLLPETDTAVAIAQLADRIGADVVCVGAMSKTGGSAVTDALLGSVAHALLSRARRPLMVVPRAE